MMIYRNWEITLQWANGQWLGRYEAITGEAYTTSVKRTNPADAEQDAKREVDRIENEIKRETTAEQTT